MLYSAAVEVTPPCPSENDVSSAANSASAASNASMSLSATVPGPVDQGAVEQTGQARSDVAPYLALPEQPPSPVVCALGCGSSFYAVSRWPRQQAGFRPAARPLHQLHDQAAERSARPARPLARPSRLLLAAGTRHAKHGSFANHHATRDYSHAETRTQHAVCVTRYASRDTYHAERSTR